LMSKIDFCGFNRISRSVFVRPEGRARARAI
jgi:hypothetical protein